VAVCDVALRRQSTARAMSSDADVRAPAVTSLMTDDDVTDDVRDNSKDAATSRLFGGVGAGADSSSVVLQSARWTAAAAATRENNNSAEHNQHHQHHNHHQDGDGRTESKPSVDELRAGI